MNKKELKNREMEEIIGGAVASSLINAVSKAVGLIYELGKQTGSALRRITSGKYCPIK